MALTGFPELIPSHTSGSDTPSQKHLVEYYSRIGQFCDAAHDEAQALQQDIPEIKEIADALDYLMGMQWKEQMPSYRARPVSNELWNNFWECIGLLTDVKPMFNISEIGNQDSRIARILNPLGKAWASTSRFERSLAFCTMFGMLTSAPARLVWSPFAHGYSGDPQDAGMIFEAIPARSLLRLGDMSNNVQDDELVCYRRVRTLNWIKRAYPRMGVMVRPEEQKSKYTVDVQSPITVMPQLFQNLSPAAKRMMGASEKTTTDSVFPKAEVREFWMKDDTVNESRNIIKMGPEGSLYAYLVKPGQKMYPRGRVIVRANGVTLWDEPSPYFHRKFPFSILGLLEVPWQTYAMSVISPWMKQQDILNQMLAGVLNCVKKAINPPLIASKQAIHPEAMRAIDSSKPNLKITYNGMTGQPPVWGQPPNVPAYVFQAYGIVQTSMKQSSGAAAMDVAAGKKQVPGGDTLDKITFAKNTPIRLMGRNLEDFVDDIGGMWTSNALQFYDAGQRMELLGEKGLVKEDYDNNPGTLIPDGIDSEQFVRRYKFKCDKGTLLNVQRQDKIQISFALRKNKDLSRKQLFQQLDWNIDLKANDEELMEEAKQIAQAMAAAGIQPGAKGHGHK